MVTLSFASLKLHYIIKHDYYNYSLALHHGIMHDNTVPSTSNIITQFVTVTKAINISITLLKQPLDEVSICDMIITPSLSTGVQIQVFTRRYDILITLLNMFC